MAAFIALDQLVTWQWQRGRDWLFLFANPRQKGLGSACPQISGGLCVALGLKEGLLLGEALFSPSTVHEWC